ncbi:J domain-containing protein [Pseudarthrobacter sp. NamE5]|uniref:J domain-containing protein n=1 Tax=Pseudarthrobacter sp. NamE5 TaxID=2576839 RepID=UPI00110BBD0F|nr:J domain-containing protein [Pseudarthrobacter sp. NamE5]TLM81850.1 J domain-containing protein [Pseudarthrobacter sp. NamE5]
MTDTPDYYAILRLRPQASQQEISRAYRALMRNHHPDVDGGTTPEGELLEIMQAFTVLRDPARRAAYDKQRAPATSQAVPVRKVRRPGESTGPAIRITPVRWESGPWA